MQQRNKMVISPVWLQVAVLTFILGFAVLGYLAYVVHRQHPPIASQVLGPDGQVLYTGDDVLRGQHTFQRFGLMQHGSLFGHGAYLGPDFTAQYLHREAVLMIDYYQRQGLSEAESRARVARELKANTYDQSGKTLAYSPGRAHAFEQLRTFYRDYFGSVQEGLQRPRITQEQSIHALAAYFSWAAWTSSTLRPGTTYSYTNNWPPEPLADNHPTPQAFVWSALSLVALLGGAGLVFFAFGRWDLLGWHRRELAEGEALQFRKPEQVGLTASQRAVAWYFLVVAGLFLLQGLLGGVNAHYHVEPEGFYGLSLAKWLPYNLSRTWHLQLALFFVAASFLALGIFITPMIARREPKHQHTLAIALFGAVVLVVVGSLAGEALSYREVIGHDGPWFWLGAQGWEYLDLGRVWQILLIGGMAAWVLIILRGLIPTLRKEHPGNMPFLFLYSALSIPLFYAVGTFFGKDSNFAVVDFWRFWVVHLWVEDFLELFTTIMVAYIFVLLGVVRLSTATRVVYLDIILYSVGGVIGTMHHMYFSGAPARWAPFSPPWRSSRCCC